jgi:hypothetical protein
MVQLALDRAAVPSGDVITAKVSVGGEQDDSVRGGRVELISVNRFREKQIAPGPNGTVSETTVTSEETVVVAGHPLPAASDGPVALGEHTFTLQVPPDAPPTANEPDFGSMVRWEVRAMLDRRLAVDPDATIEVEVQSLPDQYGDWAASPPVADTDNVPMGFDQLSKRSLRPGEQITGVLTINPGESAKARSVRVQFERRRTDTPNDMVDSERESETELARHVELEAGKPLQYPFQIPLPEGVPPTFSAPKSNMRWYLQGIVDRKLHADFTVEAEVVVYTGAAGAVAAQPTGDAAPQPTAVPPPPPGDTPATPGSFQPGS